MRVVTNSWKLKKELVKFLCHLLKCQGMFSKETTKCSLSYFSKYQGPGAKKMCSSLILIFKMNYVFRDLNQMLCIFKRNRINKNLVTM